MNQEIYHIGLIPAAIGKGALIKDNKDYDIYVLKDNKENKQIVNKWNICGHEIIATSNKHINRFDDIYNIKQEFIDIYSNNPTAIISKEELLKIVI